MRSRGVNVAVMEAVIASARRPDAMRDEHANGLLIVFVIDDVDSVCARRDGVAIATPPV